MWACCVYKEVNDDTPQLDLKMQVWRYIYAGTVGARHFASRMTTSQGGVTRRFWDTRYRVVPPTLWLNENFWPRIFDVFFGFLDLWTPIFERGFPLKTRYVGIVVTETWFLSIIGPTLPYVCAWFSLHPTINSKMVSGNKKHTMLLFVPQSDDTCYCDICERHVGGGPTNFEKHKTSGTHQKKLAKANLPLPPAKAQITNSFGPPKPKPTTLPPPSITLQHFQPEPPEDSINDLNTESLTQLLRLIKTFCYHDFARWQHPYRHQYWLATSPTSLPVSLMIPLHYSYLIKMPGRILLIQPLIGP